MKAAVIGTGFGARVVAPVYANVGFEVEVVTPRDPEAVRAACSSDVDLVSVHSPPFLHPEHVALAVGNGHHVLCDKPFGTSSEDARQMLAMANDAGVVHLLNFEFRHDAPRARIKALIDEGAIGAPQHVSWTMFSGASRKRRHGWLFDRESGGGWIGAYGSHVIDTLRWWLGEVEGVTGLCRTEIAIRPDAGGNPRTCTAEDAFSASLTFAGGATATIDTAFASAVTRPQEVQVLGSDGLLVLDGATDLTLLRHREEPQRFDFPPPAGDVHEPAFIEWATRVRDAVRDGRQIEPSFDDGLACAVVMENLRTGALSRS